MPSKADSEPTDENVFPFSELARHIVSNDYGEQGATVEDAAQAVMKKVSISDVVAIDFLKTWNGILDEIVSQHEQRNDNAEPDFTKKPEDAKKFSDIKVGDILYRCSLMEDGGFEWLELLEAEKCVVVHVDDEGCVRGVPVGLNHGVAFWVRDVWKQSEREALQAGAEAAITALTPILTQAQKIIEEQTHAN